MAKIRLGRNDYHVTFSANMHRVVIVCFPGVQVLDVTGPAATFAMANRVLGREHYRVQVASTSGKPIETNSAVTIASLALHELGARRIQTLLMAGGGDAGVQAASADRKLRAWFVRAARRAARYGSVCSGAVLLASFGLLDGRRAATHWDSCALLREQFPNVQVDADALYVVDGNVWTSAGITTGIDMALAMVENDLGAEVAGAVAQRLVVYARRPGHQSQFSAVLRAQLQAGAPYAKLVDWVHANLERDLGVGELARRAGQSARDFHRKFSRATGQTPAKFVENLRLERVRLLLAEPLALKEIAGQTGFGSQVRMSRAFERRFGVKPSVFRELLPAAG